MPSGDGDKNESGGDCQKKISGQGSLILRTGWPIQPSKEAIKMPVAWGGLEAEGEAAAGERFGKQKRVNRGESLSGGGESFTGVDTRSGFL